MADTVSTIELFNSPERLIVKFLNLSDGTGESAVIKVDKSTYTGTNGLEPTSFKIDKIKYDVAGMEVALLSDHTTDIVLARLGGMGYGVLDYENVGGITTAGSGGTGDILLTTNGHSAGDSYDITLELRKID